MRTLYKNVIVGIDDSEHAESVLGAALRLAKDANAKLYVVSAVPYVMDNEPSYGLADGFAAINPYINIEVQDLQDAVNYRKKRLEHYLKHLEEIKISDYKVVVEFGDPKTLLLEQLSDYHQTLIVLGATSKKNLERMLLGSVTQYIVNHAPCDVWIIK